MPLASSVDARPSKSHRKSSSHTRIEQCQLTAVRLAVRDPDNAEAKQSSYKRSEHNPIELLRQQVPEICIAHAAWFIPSQERTCLPSFRVSHCGWPCNGKTSPRVPHGHPHLQLLRQFGLSNCLEDWTDGVRIIRWKGELSLDVTMLLQRTLQALCGNQPSVKLGPASQNWPISSSSRAFRDVCAN